MIHKAVILARGLGTRMQKQVEGLKLDEQTRKAADAGAKALIPVSEDGRPFLDYGIQELLDAGFTDICLVIAPDNSVMRDRYQKISDRASDFRIHFACQVEPRGTADAVHAAEEFAGDDEFVMVNCDNLYSVPALRALRQARAGACYAAGYEREAMIANGNIEPERISRFAAVDVDDDWNLRRIVEKPERPEAYAINGKVYVSMNLFRFTRHIFEACANILPDPVRGELELPTAAQYVIDHRLALFKIIPTTEGVLDLTSQSDIGPLQGRLRDRILKFG